MFILPPLFLHLSGTPLCNTPFHVREQKKKKKKKNSSLTHARSNVDSVTMLRTAIADFLNADGHSICTPSRASIMSGRFASHTGMQHSYLLTGTDVNLPTKFKTLANHLNEQGYSSHMVGKWHLGNVDPQPLAREQVLKYRCRTVFSTAWTRTLLRTLVHLEPTIATCAASITACRALHSAAVSLCLRS
jgi:hypothetical protein